MHYQRLYRKGKSNL